MSFVTTPAVPLSASRSLYLHQCSFENCAPGHSYGPAVRDHYLLHCVFRGNGRFSDASRSLPLHAGQGFLITPGIVTYYQASMDTPWQYGWVGFNGEDAAYVLSLCGIRPEQPVFDFADVAGVEACIHRMSIVYRREGSSFDTTAELFRFFSLLQPTGTRNLFAGASVWERAVDYIHKNYSYPLTVEGVAAYVGISRSQLFRLFKRSLGVSPQEYLLQTRLEQAVLLLRTTELSVTEALFSCGFNEPGHFAQQFRKRYGYPPSRYPRRGIASFASPAANNPADGR